MPGQRKEPVQQPYHLRYVGCERTTLVQARLAHVAALSARLRILVRGRLRELSTAARVARLLEVRRG